MKKLRLVCLILAVIALGAELFLFNFRTFESMTFSPISGYDLTDENGIPVVPGQTLTANADNT